MYSLDIQDEIYKLVNKKTNMKKKILIVGALIVLTFIALFFNPLEYISTDKISTFISSFGIFGPLVFGLLYIIISLFGISAAALTILAGVLFSLPVAMSVVVISATIVATLGFLISRYFSKYLPNKGSKLVKKIEEKCEKNGFLAIAVLRLLFLPYMPLSYAAGLVKKLKLRDFVLATFLTNIFGSFFFIFLGYSLTKSLPYVIVAIILLIGFFQIPKLLKKKS